MTQIILNASVSSQLHGLKQPVELCDPSGQVLGRFVPSSDISQWEPVSPGATEEELDLREQSNDWLTIDEVTAYLNSLEKK
jgi:hypothetical protein